MKSTVKTEKTRLPDRWNEANTNLSKRLQAITHGDKKSEISRKTGFSADRVAAYLDGRWSIPAVFIEAVELAYNEKAPAGFGEGNKEEPRKPLISPHPKECPNHGVCAHLSTLLALLAEVIAKASADPKTREVIERRIARARQALKEDPPQAPGAVSS